MSSDVFCKRKVLLGDSLGQLARGQLRSGSLKITPEAA